MKKCPDARYCAALLRNPDLNDRADELAIDVTLMLMEHASKTQENVLKRLDNRVPEKSFTVVEKFWITNAILVRSKLAVLELFRNVEGVMLIDSNNRVESIPVIQENKETISSLTATIEPGLLAIGANKMWARSYYGQGTIVMNIDTGVDSTHPALVSNWRGNHVPYNQAWKDVYHNPVELKPYECDVDSHGTHTMGIMCGNNAINAIGVAPGAEWIASNAVYGKRIECRPLLPDDIYPGFLYTYNVLAAMQWAMDPDNNPLTTNDRPIVINNSWKDMDSGDCTSNRYISAVRNLEASGIAVVFAAGNLGPGSRTIEKPAFLTISTGAKNIPLFVAVGSIDARTTSLPIANDSSRGPSICSGSGTLSIKPDLVAPGVSVLSSIVGGYDSYSGTSMAAPHLSGAIALLKSAFPTKNGVFLKRYLIYSARDLGLTGKDNTFGFGIIDVDAAFNLIKSGVIIN